MCGFNVGLAGLVRLGVSWALLEFQDCLYHWVLDLFMFQRWEFWLDYRVEFAIIEFSASLLSSNIKLYVGIIDCHYPSKPIHPWKDAKLQKLGQKRRYITIEESLEDAPIDTAHRLRIIKARINTLTITLSNLHTPNNLTTALHTNLLPLRRNLPLHNLHIARPHPKPLTTALPLAPRPQRALKQRLAKRARRRLVVARQRLAGHDRLVHRKGESPAFRGRRGVVLGEGQVGKGRGEGVVGGGDGVGCRGELGDDPEEGRGRGRGVGVAAPC